MTIGYTSYNVFANLGTFGIILVIQAIKVLILLVLTLLRRFDKRFKTV